MLFDMEAEVLAREGKFGRFNSNRNNGYRELCRAVAENYSCLTFEEYLNNFNFKNKFIILRHDVDRMPENNVKYFNVNLNSNQGNIFILIQK